MILTSNHFEPLCIKLTARMGMNKRIVLLLNASAFVLLTVFIILHVNDHHKIRSSLMEINEESSENVFNWVPGRPLAGFREDKVTDLLDFRNESVQWIGHAKTDLSFEDSLTLMRGLCSLNPEHSGEMMSSNSPRAILSDLRKGGGFANCGHLSILLTALVRSNAVNARKWRLEGQDGLGGNTHAVVEIYLPNLGKWVLLDPLYNAYFSRNGEPMGVMELRNALLKGNYQGINIDRVMNQRQRKEETENAGSYRKFIERHIEHILLEKRSDVAYKSMYRYGMFNRWARLIDELPRPVQRFVDNAVGQREVLVHYLDGHAERYHALRYYYGFRLILFLWGVSFLWMLLGIISFRVKNKTRSEATENRID